MTIIDIFDALKFAIPLLGAAFAWLWNERRRRAADEYERKEKKYSVLIESAEGFYVHLTDPAQSKQLKETFLAEFRKCWLYCPDEVILAANAWLEMQKEGVASTNEQRLHAIGKFMLAVRRDLLMRKPVRRTTLIPADYKHLRVN